MDMEPTFDQKQETYQVATPVYEGPLDLLLQLIERAELDVTKLSLALVTDQYLDYLKKMETKIPEEVSEFLVIATRLMQIKSEVLLPRPPEREPGEEDPGEELIKQLLIYKKYKEFAQFLAAREEMQLHSYYRLAPPPKVEGKLDLTGLTIEDLYEAAKMAFDVSEEKPSIETIVNIPKVTIKDMIKVIALKMKDLQRITFQNLIDNNISRADVVITFLAMLELVKRHQIIAEQEGLFGEISIEKTVDWSEVDEIEVEFTE